MSDPAFQTATQLARQLRARKIGCLELLNHYLDRVERYNPGLNAIIVMDIEGARRRARAADRALAKGEVWGPLHGLPMTVKESHDLTGHPTTWGIPAMAKNKAGSNALLVDRYLGAGAVVFGKTNVPLSLADFQSYNDIYGTTNNPWNPERVPGGSSGGSAAALAAGLTALESGSDIGGSIRNPAAYCGVYGHKPSWGIVPPRGHALPGVLSQSDISVVGPLGRSAADLGLALSVIAGPDVLQSPGWQLRLPAPAKKSLKEYRVAVWRDEPLAPVDGSVLERIDAVAKALRRAGAKVDEKARPEIDPAKSHAAYLHLLWSVMSGRQPQKQFDANLRKVARLKRTDVSDRAIQLRASVLYHREWLRLNEQRTHLRWRWHEFFQKYDVLLTPVTVTAAFPHDHSTEQDKRTMAVNGKQVPYWRQLFWAGLTGLVYLPSTVAPAGLTADGLPVGIQVVGPELGDRTTIDFARLLAREIGGFTAPPGYD